MNGFMGNTELSLEVKNCTNEGIDELVESVPGLILNNVSEKDGLILAQFEYGKENDPREKVFKHAVKSKWIITEMSSNSAGLESIFRTLTMEKK